MEFTARFGIGASYGGAFSNIPERVGSAPATDFTVVRFNFMVMSVNAEVWQFSIRFSIEQEQTTAIWKLRR